MYQVPPMAGVTIVLGRVNSAAEETIDAHGNGCVGVAGALDHANVDPGNRGVLRHRLVEFEIEGVVKRLLFEMGQQGHEVAECVHDIFRHVKHGHRVSTVGVLVVIQRQGELFHVVGALNSARCLARLLHGRQQQGKQYADDRNDHEQLNQSETPTRGWDALWALHCGLQVRDLMRINQWSADLNSYFRAPAAEDGRPLGASLSGPYSNFPFFFASETSAQV